MTQQPACIIVSHTHWDRAWYLPFEAFRFRMIEAVDDVLQLLKSDQRFCSFTLDGQAVLIEDYLEIRPEKEGELRELVESEKLSVGPWYTLPDVFLSGGESLIRNLQTGIKLSKRFGNYLKVGYVPDPFGHVSQMPQILNGFGLNSYMFMRGKPESLEDNENIFKWKSKDGSQVLAVNLKNGYFLGSALGHQDVFGRYDGHQIDDQLLFDRVSKHFDTTEMVNAPTLICNGGDHMPAQAELPDMIERLKAKFPDYDFIHGDFSEYVDLLRSAGIKIPEYSGELFGNKDHPILANVFSSRIYLKKLHHSAQSMLSRYLEPMVALSKLFGVEKDYTPFIDRAWRMLLKCQAHDDIGGCSVDEVHEDNEVSFRKILSLSQEIVKDVLEKCYKIGFENLCQKNIVGRYFLFNPHPFSVSDEFQLNVLVEEDELKVSDDFSLKVLDDQGKTIEFRLSEQSDGAVRNNFLETTNGRIHRLDVQAFLPPLGYSVLSVVKEDNKSPITQDENTEKKIKTIENDLYKVFGESESVNLYSKNMDLLIENFIKIEYAPDRGDTYSFGPDPEINKVFARINSVEKSDNNSLMVHFRLDVPKNKNTTNATLLEIAVEISLNHQKSVSLFIDYKNNIPDSRLRVRFSSALFTDSSFADGHFCIEKRVNSNESVDYSPRVPEYPGELNYPTNFQNDFVMLSGEAHSVWVANKGLHEYEVCNDKDVSEIAVTLHRAVGKLSVNGGGIRSCHAGPGIDTPGAQCLRQMRHELAFGVTEKSETNTADVTRLAKCFAHPPVAIEFPNLPFLNTTGPILNRDSMLCVENPDVLISCFRYDLEKNIYVLRLYNIDSKPQQTGVELSPLFRRYHESNFFENWSENEAKSYENSRMTISFKEGEIKTILLKTER